MTYRTSLEPHPTLKSTLLQARPPRAGRARDRGAQERLVRGPARQGAGRRRRQRRRQVDADAHGRRASCRRPAGGSRSTGRVSTLLSLGVGFNRKLTGRQNVVLGGLAAGLTRAELREKYDEIVAFAELEDFMDMPMRTYSSGMYGRLAFAVAVTMEPGHPDHRRGAVGRRRALPQQVVPQDAPAVRRGPHDPARHPRARHVEKLCDQAIWMHKGELRMWDEPDAVVDAYTEFLGVRDEDEDRRSRWRTSRPRESERRSATPGAAKTRHDAVAVDPHEARRRLDLRERRRL